jgi:response regulator RpfG family c-di-GMP phosphodiesterase
MSENLVARILCVDDEIEVLYALKRLLRSSDFLVDLASDPDQALDMVMHNNYDLIISDMRMPKLDGAELLAAAAKFSPQSRRVLLTGYSDQESTARAINQGKIHAYIEKPWDNKKFVERVMGLLHSKLRDDEKAREVDTLKESYESMKSRKMSLNDQVRRTNRQLEKTVAFLNVEQDELRTNLSTFIKIFASTSIRHCQLPAEFLGNLLFHLESCSAKLYMNDIQRQCVFQAAQLAQIGKLSLPASIATAKATDLSVKDTDLLKHYPRESVDMLTPLDALAESSLIIEHHQENFDGSGYPSGLAEHNIPLGSRLLRILLDFNVAISESGCGGCMSSADAILLMREGSSIKYDPDLLEICIAALEEVGLPSRQGALRFDELSSGDELLYDVLTSDGVLLAAADSHVTDQMLRRFNDVQNSRKEKLVFFVK